MKHGRESEEISGEFTPQEVASTYYSDSIDELVKNCGKNQDGSYYRVIAFPYGECADFRRGQYAYELAALWSMTSPRIVRVQLEADNYCERIASFIGGQKVWQIDD